MVCISFIPWKSDGKLSNFHSVYIINTRFLTFVEISWISNGNRTSFHHVHPSVHSGNYVTSTSEGNSLLLLRLLVQYVVQEYVPVLVGNEERHHARESSRL